MGKIERKRERARMGKREVDGGSYKARERRRGRELEGGREKGEERRRGR